MTKVKICGFTIAENAQQAALAGVDAIGLVFYDKSPRHVSIDVAREIVSVLYLLLSIESVCLLMPIQA